MLPRRAVKAQQELWHYAAGRREVGGSPTPEPGTSTSRHWLYPLAIALKTIFLPFTIRS
jgi:hypothetical protein